MAISREQEMLLEIRWWQNELIFEAFKIKKNFFFYFGYRFLVALSQRQKELPELSRFLKTILIFRFWISGLGGDISEIKELP